LSLTAGARHDEYSDFGGTTNPRLALVWQATDQLTGKLMVGTAFRAPSYQELYARTSATLPNPDLEPERTRTWDLSFTYLPWRSLRVGASFFDFKIDDIISGNSGRFLNGEQHRIRGLELDAHWQPADTLTVIGSYTSRQQDTTSAMSYGVPDQEGYVRADWTIRPGWQWSVQTNWTGERQLPAGDPRPRLGSHALTDTTVRVAAGRQWEMGASVRNLFDVDAREYTGSRALTSYLPLPGRNAFAELRYKF
jgi:iron complex outermembrane receptor protein